MGTHGIFMDLHGNVELFHTMVENGRNVQSRSFQPWIRDNHRKQQEF
jgi:hypothetical protein